MLQNVANMFLKLKFLAHFVILALFFCVFGPYPFGVFSCKTVALSTSAAHSQARLQDLALSDPRKGGVMRFSQSSF